MIKKQKIYIYIFIILALIFNIKVTYVYAEGTASGEGNNSLDLGGGNGKGNSFCENNHWYNPKYNYTLTSYTRLQWSIYDMYGNDIINGTKIAEDDAVKAGTWIGVNATETISANYTLTDFTATESFYGFTCRYTRVTGECESLQKTTCTEYGISGECLNGEPSDVSNCCKWNWKCTKYKTETRTKSGEISKCEGEDSIDAKCKEMKPSGYDYKNGDYTSDEITRNVDGSELNNIKNAIIGKLCAAIESYVSSNSSKVLKYSSDDIYPSNKSDTIISEGSGIKGECKSESGDKYQNYEYVQPQVCINIKTSKVTYGRKCNDDEFTIENGTAKDGNKFWHYFIPLSIKSTDNLYLQLLSNSDSNNYSNKICKSIMKKKYDAGEDYRAYISPVDEKISFTGDYETDIDKLGDKGKCKASISINIPIEQKFYNEIDENGTKKFKGFNFYYKPIDITNPFPNGLTQSSLWYEWLNDKSGEKLDISDSFSKKTYEINVNNLYAIRQYNSDYTDWSTMSLNGKNSFIDDYDITRYTNDFYPLGCGAKNSDASNKILYIKECTTNKYTGGITGGSG